MGPPASTRCGNRLDPHRQEVLAFQARHLLF